MSDLKKMYKSWSNQELEKALVIAYKDYRGDALKAIQNELMSRLSDAEKNELSTKIQEGRNRIDSKNAKVYDEDYKGELGECRNCKKKNVPVNTNRIYTGKIKDVANKYEIQGPTMTEIRETTFKYSDKPIEMKICFDCITKKAIKSRKNIRLFVGIVAVILLGIFFWVTSFINLTDVASYIGFISSAIILGIVVCVCGLAYYLNTKGIKKMTTKNYNLIKSEFAIDLEHVGDIIAVEVFKREGNFLQGTHVWTRAGVKGLKASKGKLTTSAPVSGIQ